MLHVHWPEAHLNRPWWWQAAYRSIRLVLRVFAAQRRGAKLVWTAHNLAAHDSRWRRTQAVLWRVWVERIDGWIALNEHSREAVVGKWSRLADVPHCVTALGHFIGAFGQLPDRATARAATGFPAEAVVVAFVGRIKPYKGVESLLEAFAEVDDPSMFLLVAGRIDNAALRSRLETLTAANPRVRLEAAHLTEAELQTFVRGADLVVAPFTDILNSASVLLALSLGTPVLVPALGSMHDLREQVSDPWVQLFDSPLTGAGLQRAAARARQLDPSAMPDLSAFDRDSIAAATSAFFERLLEHSAT